MVLWIIRALFVVMIVVIVILGGLLDVRSGTSMAVSAIGFISVIIIGLIIDLLVRRKSLAALAGVFFGLLAGSLIGLIQLYRRVSLSNPSHQRRHGFIQSQGWD